MNTTLHVPRDRRALAARIDPLLRTPLATFIPEQVLEVRTPGGTVDRGGHREQRRVVNAEVRFLDEEEHPGRFRAVVLRYGVVDTYDTVFAKGVFNASLEQQMPAICWAHHWDKPVGRWVAYEETDTELILTGELDLDMIPGTDTPAVPLAHQARVQLRSGTVHQFSVGFLRTSDRDGSAEYGEGVRVITGGVLDEVSIVLVGAVPGTHTIDAPRTAPQAPRTPALSVRMPGIEGDAPVMVPLPEAAAILARMAVGELDLADGLTALKALATTGDDGTGGSDSDSDSGGDSDSDSGGDPATSGGGDGSTGGANDDDGTATAGTDGDPGGSAATGENDPDTGTGDSGGGDVDALLAEADAALEAINR